MHTWGEGLVYVLCRPTLLDVCAQCGPLGGPEAYTLQTVQSLRFACSVRPLGRQEGGGKGERGVE